MISKIYQGAVEQILRHYIARLVDFTPAIHSYTLPERERISGVDAKELDRKQDRIDRRLLLPQQFCFVQDALKLARQLRVRPERMHIPDTSEDLLRQLVCLSPRHVQLVLDLAVDHNADGHHDQDSRYDAHADQRELPLDGESDNEGREERGGGLYGQAELLGDALVDEIAATVDASGYGARLGGVEVRDLLSERLLEKVEA